MDKQAAIKLIRDIQNGHWDRNKPMPPRGSIAVDKWDESLFSLGMEYGAIVMLMQLAGLTQENT